MAMVCYFLKMADFSNIRPGGDKSDVFEISTKKNEFYIMPSIQALPIERYSLTASKISQSTGS